MGALVETPDRLPLPPEPRRAFHRACRRALRPLFRAGFGMAGEGTEHIFERGEWRGYGAAAEG